MVVLAARPAVEHEAAQLVRALAVALRVREPGQRGGAVALHRDDVEARRGLQAALEQRPRLLAAAAPRVDRAEDAVGDERVVRRRRPAAISPPHSSSTWSQSPSSRRT